MPVFDSAIVYLHIDMNSEDATEGCVTENAEYTRI